MTMAHTRKRHMMEIFKKKMNFSPIVSIQGPRQCGKSFFAKEMVAVDLPNSMYLSLDKKENRTFAVENPGSFVQQNSSDPMIIDEAQKAPDLFDEIKAVVDNKRKPGQFVLLGSTEFSHETKVRESLTGRLSRTRLYPFSIAEILHSELLKGTAPFFINKKNRIDRFELLRYLNNGGFPGVFNVKNENERQALLDDWINLTVERDINQIKKFKLDAEEARQILAAIAKEGEPNLANLASATGISSRRMQSYLTALKQLFVIFEVLPFAGSTGKPIYFLTDTGLLTYYEANFDKKLLTWLYLEIYTQRAYRLGNTRPLYFFRTSKGSFMDIMIETEKGQLVALKLLPRESFNKRDLVIFESISKRFSKQYKIKNVLLTGGSSFLKTNSCEVHPWESII
jgi:predicted AAA+ superfamily ATPase